MGQYELSVFQKNDVTITINLQDSNGSAIDITGYTFYFSVKTDETDTDVEGLITKKVTSHTDPTNGQTEVALSDSDMDITPGKYFYDVKMKDSSGNLTTWVKDVFKVAYQITQDDT